MVGEAFNESVVEVDEADERLHLLLASRSGSFGDTSDFDRIHFDLVVRDDHPKVLDALLLEFAFLCPKV